MPGIDGLEATRPIMAASHPPPALMLTTSDRDDYASDALVAGASGFLLKDGAPEQLPAGIRAIAQGNSLLSPSVTRRLTESFIRDHRPHSSRQRAWTSSPPRAGDPPARRPRPIQRRAARRVQHHHQDARCPGARQARAPRPHLPVVLAYQTGIIRPGSTS